LYEGVEHLLKELNVRGCNLFLATSKPYEYALQVLKNFKIYNYFKAIGAASFDGSKTKKSEILRSLIDDIGNLDLTKSAMIGDRLYDIEGAKSVGISSIAVLYGYGDEEELRQANPDFMVKSVAELLQLLL